jgi:cold shock CspA family protein
MGAGMSPDKDFIGVRCYGTVTSFDPATGSGLITPTFGESLTFHATGLGDTLLMWLSPGMPVSFIRATSETGPPVASVVRPGGPAIAAKGNCAAPLNGASQREQLASKPVTRQPASSPNGPNDAAPDPRDVPRSCRQRRGA